MRRSLFFIVAFLYVFIVVNCNKKSSIGPEQSRDIVTDIDGNTYPIVTIGEQVWMAENLKVTRYRNGEAIPKVLIDIEWEMLDRTEKGAYCVRKNYEANVDTFGYLYNWYAVNDSRNIAPEGWHVPTEGEWKELEMYLGMSQSEAENYGNRGTDEGGKLKETGTVHWRSPNEGATNESGFTALPGGRRIPSGNYSPSGFEACFWSGSEKSDISAWIRMLQFQNSEIGRDRSSKLEGCSIRLIQDRNTVTDVDGNVYNTVQIDDQVWVAENLKVTHYRNGDDINCIISGWENASRGAHCYYDNDEENIGLYGMLYNWYVINDSKNIAPEGWHVPTDEDWQTLFDYLGGIDVAAGKMKSTGTIEDGTGLWHKPNYGATNESGFTALPGGWRNDDTGDFDWMGENANFWSSSEGSISGYGSVKILRSSSPAVNYSPASKTCGFSIRVIKD